MVRRRFPFAIALTASVLALAPTSPGPLAAQENLAVPPRRAPLRSGPVGIPARVAQAAARDGRVRVIIGLNVPFRAEGALSVFDQVQQRVEIAAVQSQVEAALAPFGIDSVKRFHVIPAMGAEVAANALARLASLPGVAYVEEDALAEPSLAESTALIGATNVWASGYTGAGQTIAILDTGVESAHPFLAGRVVSQACFSTTSAINQSTSVCAGGAPSALGDGTAEPCNVGGCDHGTHVAGIAAGHLAPMRGVAPGATVIAIQVYSQFPTNVRSYSTDQISAMQRVYDLRDTFDIAAVNLSLGGARFSTEAECDAANTSRKAIIDTLRSVGIATIIASGNDEDPFAVAEPGCISSAISVGSTTDGSNGAFPADQVSTFTNTAPFLKLLAPGQYILSSILGSTFGIKAGTSMAAPHVAGAWALLRSRYADATVQQILSTLVSTGTPVLDPANGLTFRRINVDAAMTALGVTCTYELSISSTSVSAIGGRRSVELMTPDGCPWYAASNASFITILGDISGTGPRTFEFLVGRNDGDERTGTLTIAGHTITVTQSAIGHDLRVDFNGDGRLDLLWHHRTDGRISSWLMNGTTFTGSAQPTPSAVPDTTWRLVGAGDLDADSHADLVWQNTDGRVSAWLMNGLTVREGTLLGIPSVADLQWKIRAVGDMDDDGRADLIWQHEGNGGVAAWLMDGAAVREASLLSPAAVTDLRWTIAGAADIDGNGTRDIVWHHQDDGRVGVWFMDGLTQASGALTNPGSVPDTNWKLRGVGDLDGDRHPDFIWQHVVDGRVSAWLMDGLNLKDGRLLSPGQIADTNWHVVAPR